MAKLLENTFRSVNIGMVNELALMCHRMKIDVWEVIDAARTKPFGFMPFYPGPGPRRPLHPDRPVLPVVEGAPERLRGALHRAGRPGEQLDAGVGGDAGRRRAQHREEGRERIARPRVRRRLQEERRRHARVAGAGRHRAPASAAARSVTYSDPFVPSFKTDGHTFTAIGTADALASKPDCVVITTDHDVFDYKELVEKAAAHHGRAQRAEGVRRPHIHRL